MFNKSKIVGSLAGLGFLLALTPNIALAQKDIKVKMPASAGERTSEQYPALKRRGLRSLRQFQKIEQPLSLKLAVALGGLGLIGAELWWFMFSRTKSQKAQVKQGIQEVNSTPP